MVSAEVRVLTKEQCLVRISVDQSIDGHVSILAQRVNVEFRMVWQK